MATRRKAAASAPASEELVGRDLYARVTDKKGSSHIERYRVWDAARFIDTRSREAADSGGRFQPATETEYLEQQLRARRSR